jgi:hypothetical protein
MPTGDHIDVTPTDLVAHATRIDAIAEQVATAHQAGQAVRLGVDGYGKLCTIVPALLDGLQGLLVDGIDTAARSLHDTAARLRAAATGYQTADEHSAAVHHRIRGAR